MSADPNSLPSGFSVVSDSIRRDREALFGATRAEVPTIVDCDDSSDGSVVETPVFFTTAGSDAETEAGGFGGPLSPGLLSLKSPEARSNELARAHPRSALGERIDETDDEEHGPFRSADARASDEAASSASSSDDDTDADVHAPPIPPGASLDLGSALGGSDLDGLLRRLAAAGGEAVVARATRRDASREGGFRSGASSGDERGSSDAGDAVTNEATDDGGGVAARGRRRAAGRVGSSAARDAARRARRDGDVAGAERGPKRGSRVDSYGCGTRRGRRGARPRSASPIATSATRTNARERRCARRGSEERSSLRT